MKKILITGFSGFVSYHFIKYLISQKINCEILGIDINEPDFKIKKTGNIKILFKKIDLLDTLTLEKCIHSFQPENLLHLASYSSVGFSWKNPSKSFRNNMDIFLNLLEIIRKIKPSCRILSIGSSEEYGDVTNEMIPLKEEYPLSPVSPYAVARVAQENLSKVYCVGYGLDIIMTRSFNHIGPSQKDIFVISSFVKQFVERKKAGKQNIELVTGNIDIIRDFLDVRDVVAAYYKLFKKGKKGEVYNICSSTGRTLKEIIDVISGLLNMDVIIKKDNKLIRPNDNMIIVGSNEKVKTATGWKNNITLEESLKDIINYWYEKL